MQEGQQEQRFSPNAQIDLVPNDPKGDGREVTGAGALRNKKHAHTHTHALTNPKALNPKPSGRVTPAGSPGGAFARGWWWGPAQMGSSGLTLGGQLLCFSTCSSWQPRESHTSTGTYREPSRQQNPFCQPRRTGREEKNNTGWFVQVIIFIPEQLEDTSLNALPRELSERQRSELGAGGAGRRSAAPSCTHTRHGGSLKSRGDPPSCPAPAGGGLTPRKSLCQCPCTPRRCS